MKPVWAHSAECGECARPPGEPARTRGRPQRYTRLRFRECPRMTDLAVTERHLGVKLALSTVISAQRRRGSATRIAACGGRGLSSVMWWWMILPRGMSGGGNISHAMR